MDELAKEIQERDKAEEKAREAEQAARMRKKQEAAKKRSTTFQDSPYIVKNLAYETESGNIRYKWLHVLSSEFPAKAVENVDYVWKSFRIEPFMDSNGYLVVSVQGLREYLHRAVWWIVNGDPGENRLEFIDGNKLNTRIENLRLADKKRYQGRFLFEGKRHSLGYFHTIEEANAAVAEARFKLSLGMEL